MKLLAGSAAEPSFTHGRLRCSPMWLRWGRRTHGTQPALQPACLRATCRQAAAHAAMVCSGMHPVYFSAGFAPLSLAWGWLLLGLLWRLCSGLGAWNRLDAPGAGAGRAGSTPAGRCACKRSRALRGLGRTRRAARPCHRRWWQALATSPDAATAHSSRTRRRPRPAWLAPSW